MTTVTPTLATLLALAAPLGAEPSQPEVRRELLAMTEVDQAARKEVIQGKQPPDKALIEKLAGIDRTNTARMKEIIDKHGWPGKSLVGIDGAHAAWLLVQHADLDRPFQKRCLELMEPLVGRGEVTGTDLAYLTDRVRVGEGKKQLYGTQFHTVDGKMEPQPIEDEAKVDERRKAVGLGTMAEYRKQMEQVYGKPAVPKPDNP